MQGLNIDIIDSFMIEEIRRGTFPGAVLGVVNEGVILYQQAYGNTWFEPEKKEMTRDTLFDLASLTKVIATTTVIMQLIERGKFNLDDYLKDYYPELPADKKDITIRHLLTHSSGFQAIVELWKQGLSYDEKIGYILNLPLLYKTGEQVLYSDPNFILLGDLAKRVTGIEIDKYAAKNIFQPLGMNNTAFNPQKTLNLVEKMYAPTEYCKWRGRYLCGEVHDENCFSFNGITGHAGLFSNLDDLVIFTQMLLNKGSYKGKIILSPRSVELLYYNWTAELNSNRGLGWDLTRNFRSSGGVLFSSSAFGHTGFTGTSLWIDPEFSLGVILLTNRVHPNRENDKIISMRPRLHNLLVSRFFVLV